VGIVTFVKEPAVLNDVFNQDDFNSLKSLFSDYKSFEYQQGFSRYVVADNTMEELKEYTTKLIPLARSTFGSENLMPTYTLFSHYEGESASLYKHKDDNACTYTIDMCVYQKNPWDLWVENKAYTLHPNQALAYYGNDQMHWREDFPNPKENHVAMIFFHFAEPEHWYFTKGPSYLSVIRNEMTEENWNSAFNTVA
jgi:hypothetical protein